MPRTKRNIGAKLEDLPGGSTCGSYTARVRAAADLVGSELEPTAADPTVASPSRRPGSC